MGLGREKGCRPRRKSRRPRRSRRENGKKTVPVLPVEACDPTKLSLFPSASDSSSGDDDGVKRVRISDSLKVETLILSHSLEQRSVISSSQTTSGSPSFSSSLVTAMETEEDSFGFTTAPVPVPPPCPVVPAAATSGAMSKLTDSMKLKVTGYIELLKKLDHPLFDPNDKSWITLFVNDMSSGSGGMKLTTDDVLEWMEKLPAIFTPEAVDILRQHYNRLRALDQEKAAVHQNLMEVLTEMDGYEADDDSADDEVDDDGGNLSESSNDNDD